MTEIFDPQKHPDAIAYITEATQQIATEANFQPAMAEEFEQWFNANIRLIGLRAIALQFRMLEALVHHRQGQLIRDHLSNRVYQRIGRDRENPNCQQTT